MDIQEIYALMDRFEHSGLTHMELEMNDVKLSLKKGGEPVYVPVGGVPQPFAYGQESVREAGRDIPQEESALTQVRAPLVGTFYRAPGPEEEPFVTSGQSVKKGDVVGIIEAMKMMNEIVAPEDGIIEKIAVQDGVLVEYNQVLMTLRQDG